MLIQLNAEKILQIGSDVPEHSLTLCGWEYKIHYFLWTIPYIVYQKDLVRRN